MSLFGALNQNIYAKWFYICLGITTAIKQVDMHVHVDLICNTHACVIDACVYV